MTMWKKIAPLLVLLSVSLNVAFIGAWIAQTVLPPDTAESAPEDSPVWCPLHRMLDVTDSQWESIEPRIAEFRERSAALCREICDLRNEMIDLIAADEPDREAIAAKQEEISADQQRMQELVIEHLLAERDLLTVEQQKRLFSMLRQRMTCRMPARLMGLAGDRGEDRALPLGQE